MRNSLFLILMFISGIGNSQMKMYQRKNIPLLDFNGTYQLQNFYLSPGLTYMFPYEIPNILTNSNSEINAKGRLAYIIEAGAYRIFKKGGNIFFKHLNESNYDNLSAGLTPIIDKPDDKIILTIFANDRRAIDNSLLESEIYLNSGLSFPNDQEL